jgi:hypothetical protein
MASATTIALGMLFLPTYTVKKNGIFDAWSFDTKRPQKRQEACAGSPEIQQTAIFSYSPMQLRYDTNQKQHTWHAMRL